MFSRSNIQRQQKVVAWGNSLGGFITQALAEQYPDLISAAAPLCMASDLTPLMTMAGDALWGIKTFFDPTIKGGGYSEGAAGYAEAMGDLGKVLTVVWSNVSCNCCKSNCAGMASDIKGFQMHLKQFHQEVL